MLPFEVRLHSKHFASSPSIVACPYMEGTAKIQQRSRRLCGGIRTLDIILGKLCAAISKGQATTIIPVLFLF